jgi:hypothetical protein
MKGPMSKLTYLLTSIAGSLVLAATVAANPNAVVIRVTTTFDYPGSGNSTTPFGINAIGDIAGDYLDPAGVRRGFIRYSDGSFSAPIVEPNDTGNYTRCRGINSNGVVVGDYFGDNAYHGFILENGVFTEYDISSDVSTDLFGINDSGDLCGGFGSATQANEGFIDVDGIVTTFAVPGNTATYALGINSSDMIVGQGNDANFVAHGFVRRPTGALVYPIDFPGASSTILNGVSDKGWVAGSYNDSSGVTHGLFLILPRTFVSFDYPGATGTSLNGINRKGLISGRYTDSSGLRHGFIAQAKQR